MSEKPTLKIEKGPIDVDGKLEKRQELAKQLEEKLNKFREELENKNYLVEGGLATAKGLQDFVTNSAKWNFSEAMGIIEVSRQLETCVKELESGKRKELMLSNLSLEALYYFLSKENGTGLQSALAYFNTTLKPVLDALSRAKQDKEKKDQMEKDLATVLHAIDQGAVSEMEDRLIAEIEAETAQ